jgi:hypothetical protein
MGYYEALGVPHTATQAEIKRSYYLLARQLVRARACSIGGACVLFVHGVPHA